MNMQTLKSTNRSLVLYLLNKYKGLSRKEIALKLSLTPAGVTKICQTLIDEGFIIESDVVSSQGKSGRKEILLRLDIENKFVIGINAQRDNITFSYSNLNGDLVYCKKEPFLDSFEDVVSKTKEFVAEYNIQLDTVIGIGVCVIGSVGDNDYGIWHEDIEKCLANTFNLPVAIENNVKAFAVGEMIFGNIDPEKSILFLKWGAGIGSSIVSNGRVITGNDNSIAEIGHYIVDNSGVKCRCGRFGCLETVASSDAIIKEINHNLTLEDIITSEDKDIVAVLDQKIDLVALALTNTATILNTDSIVLFGEMFNNKTIANKLIKQCVRYNSNLENNMFILSSLNDFSDYIGTTAICAKKYFYELA